IVGDLSHMISSRITFPTLIVPANRAALHSQLFPHAALHSTGFALDRSGVESGGAAPARRRPAGRESCEAASGALRRSLQTIRFRVRAVRQRKRATMRDPSGVLRT